MALPTKLLLEIVTPDQSLVREEVDEVQLPGSEGYLGVLPGHAPLLTTLAVGELWFRVGQAKRFVAIASGFAEILPECVTVLARVAELAQAVDVARAEAAKKRAEERLATRPVDLDVERAQSALLRAVTRLQVASYARARV